MYMKANAFDKMNFHPVCLHTVWSQKLVLGTFAVNIWAF